MRRATGLLPCLCRCGSRRNIVSSPPAELSLPLPAAASPCARPPSPVSARLSWAPGLSVRRVRGRGRRLPSGYPCSTLSSASCAIPEGSVFRHAKLLKVYGEYSLEVALFLALYRHGCLSLSRVFAFLSLNRGNGVMKPSILLTMAFLAAIPAGAQFDCRGRGGYGRACSSAGAIAGCAMVVYGNRSVRVHSAPLR